jgi:hypothetical protein
VSRTFLFRITEVTQSNTYQSETLLWTQVHALSERQSQLLPMSSPVLRPAAWVRYTTALHLHGDKMETAATGPLPQFYADRFGWQQEVSVVLNTFRSLSPQDQRRVCIFGSNYGEAGALDLLVADQHVGQTHICRPQ